MASPDSRDVNTIRAIRSLHVDDSTPCEMAFECTGRFGFYLCPGRLRNRRQLTMEVIHVRSLP
jgi:hypothetical protein